MANPLELITDDNHAQERKSSEVSELLHHQLNQLLKRLKLHHCRSASKFPGRTEYHRENIKPQGYF